MFKQFLTRCCRLMLVAFAICLLTTGSNPSHGDDPPKKATTNGWTLDEALEQVSFHPKDPYVQFVALQLAKRAGREEEVYRALTHRNWRMRDDGGRRNPNLFSTFTGALAIQESLQLDAMRGEQPLPKQQVVPLQGIVKVDPDERQKNRAAKIAIEKLIGPTVQSHPWAKMLGQKKPDVGTLANCVPEDFYFAEFRTIAKLNDVTSLSEMWGGHIFTQALGDAKSQVTVERIKKQLGLFQLPAKAVELLEIEGIAVTGSDLFLAEGSDVTVLVHSRKIPALLPLVDGFAFSGKKVEGKYLDINYAHRTSADGSLNVYSANPRPDLHVRSNSLAGFKRVLETVVGKTADGKPAKRLGECLEFQYIRTLMPRGAEEEDGLIYLSDAFIRKLVGPQLKLTERRRVLVYNHLRMIGHGAMMFRTEHGRAPKSLEELAEKKCAPGVFGQKDLAHPDGGTYSLSADGMSGICSKYGRAESLTPCLETLVSEVDGEEAELYRNFVKDYNEYWRTYFDPIAIRVQASPKQYRLETLILPLIDNSIYSAMAQTLGGKPVALDILPTGQREIGGMWVHFEKKMLLDLLGPEVDVKKGMPDISKKEVPTVKPEPAPSVIIAAPEWVLKQLAAGMLDYQGLKGHFPPAAIRNKEGKPLLSWRVAILPYIEQNALYEKFKLDEPWDSEHNKKLLAEMPTVFRCGNPKLSAEGKTSYLLPSGKETMFPPDGSKIETSKITDGHSNTIMVLLANEESAVPWTKPDDLVIDLKQPMKSLVLSEEGTFHVAMGDGSVRQFRKTIEAANLAALFTRAGGEEVDFIADEIRAPSNRRGFFEFDRLLTEDDLRKLNAHGFEVDKLRRFLRDGIGDQIGLQMHDASKLFDFDLAGALNGSEAMGTRLGGTEVFGIGILVQYLTGPSSISIPVKDAKVVDEFLEMFEKALLKIKASSVAEFHGAENFVEFYRMPFPKDHTIRCLVVKFAGLKWRLYWGRIGDGFYLANRAFILEDIAAAQMNKKQPAKQMEPAHALLRLRPQNWKEVLPGYHLGWAENHRSACHDNLSLLANVNRGWKDAKQTPNSPDAVLTERAIRFYGVRPFCPDGGNYSLSADGKSCMCSIHGDERHPTQLASPTENSPTGKLLKSLAGLSASLTFEEDGLRAIVIIERKD